MSVFFLVFGLIFGLVGGIVLWDYIIVVKTYEILPGKVRAFQKRYKRSKNGSSLIYYPVIEYRAYGNEKEFKASSGASWPMYDIGESVEVYYSKKYDDARLKSMTQLIIGPIFLLVGLGVCYFFWSKFEPSVFSYLWTFGISGTVAWFVGTLLRRRGIKSVPDLSQKVRDLPKKVRKKDESDDDNLITSQSELSNPNSPGNTNLKIIGPFFTLVGLLAIAGSIYLGMNRWDFLERAEMTNGTVIEFQSHTDDDGTTYYPVVEFTSPNTAETITFKHDVGSSHPSYSRGDVVPVLFDPGDVNEAIIDEGLWNWFAPIIVGFLGFTFFLAGGAVTRRWLKMK